MSVFSTVRRQAIAPTFLIFSFIAASTAAHASSPDAWDEFRADVERTCLEQAVGRLDVANIFVDPFGSESYGFALMIGIGTGTSTGYMISCVYDKTSQKAETSDLFEL